MVQNNEVKWAKLFMEFIIGTAYCQSTKCQGFLFFTLCALKLG